MMAAKGLELRVAGIEKRLTRLEGQTGLRGLRSQILQLGTQMAAGFSAMERKIDEGDEQTRSQMRVLHEDVIARITLLGEGAAPHAVKAQRPRRRSRNST